MNVLSPRHRLSPPSAFLELHVRLQDATMPAARLAAEMSELPDLAAEVLRLANSPQYGMERTIDRLDRAVALLSPTVLRDVVLMLAMGRATRGIPDLGGTFSPEWMRAHAVAVARTAGVVARAANVPLEEEARTAGILHDVGMIELALRDAHELRRAHDEAAIAGEPTLEFERAHLGVDHAEIGREVVDSWGLPEPIVHAVASHHAPLRAPGGMRYLPCIVALAETMCDASVDTGRQAPDADVLHALEFTPAEWLALVPTIQRMLRVR